MGSNTLIVPVPQLYMISISSRLIQIGGTLVEMFTIDISSDPSSLIHYRMNMWPLERAGLSDWCKRFRPNP